MDDHQLIEWLFTHGGPAIRYRTATELVGGDSVPDVRQLVEDLIGSDVVGRWLGQLREPGDLWSIHGSNPDAFENVCAKLCELGLRAGMSPAFDAGLERWRQRLAQGQDFTGANIVASCLNWAGCADATVHAFLQERLSALWETAQQGSYAIYVDQDTYGDFPAAFRKRPLVNPDLHHRLPGIWDVIAIAHWPRALDSAQSRQQIETVVSYILHPDYQALEEGYGVMRAGPRRYYSMGWSIHLPMYQGAGFARAMHEAMLVQRVELMAHFRAARASAWFQRCVAHLEGFRTEAGTYRFPGAYLREQRRGYYVHGATMRLEDRGRARRSLELDSTFRMLEIQRLIGEEGT